MSNNNDTFGFGKEEQEFTYDAISGLGESNYENEDLFSTEVSSINDESDVTEDIKPQTLEVGPNKFEYGNIEIPIDYEFSSSDNNAEEKLDMPEQTEENNESIVSDENLGQNDDSMVPNSEIFDQSLVVSENIEEIVPEENVDSAKNIDDEFLDSSSSFENNSLYDSYSLPAVQPNSEVTEEIAVPQEEVREQNILSDTPIEELNKLTEFTEEKIQTTDIKDLFDRVGVNVKEASDIFKKNTEMKEKLDSRFEELKKLQSEVEKSKQAQYEEINAYKEEVLSKLTEKKEQIEERLNKLKEFQTSLEKEKEAFEQYRKTEKEEIERVQKEVQQAYDDRREELSHIEDVLRRQKDALDEERSQLSLDRIQYESDKNELANNLLKFNEIVGSFTNGMDKINKE